MSLNWYTLFTSPETACQVESNNHKNMVLSVSQDAVNSQAAVHAGRSHN